MGCLPRNTKQDLVQAFSLKLVSRYYINNNYYWSNYWSTGTRKIHLFQTQTVWTNELSFTFQGEWYVF